METSGMLPMFFAKYLEKIYQIIFCIGHFPLKDDVLLKLIVGLVTPSCHVFDENSPVLSDKLLLLKLDTSIRGHGFLCNGKSIFGHQCMR